MISNRDTVLAPAGTALAAPLALGLVAYATALFTRGRQQIGVRILGSWTAAGALLVLALRLPRAPLSFPGDFAGLWVKVCFWRPA